MTAWWTAVASFARAVATAHVVVTHVACTTVLVGPSMLPTFQPSGDVALVDRVSVALDRLTVGDVVIATCPDNPKILVCKRVTAMAGDHVTVHRGPWRLPSTVHLQVPQGHVWLQGDNVAQSRDSREYGPVPTALIKGRVVLQLWPPWRAKVIGRDVWHESS